jgi:arylsulfatase A-like enzyme
MIGSRPPRPPLAAARTAIIPALIAAWLCGCGSPARPNILLVVIDTARADRFSFDGYAKDTSPEIAAAGREGAVYERAYTPAPWTLPAHASLFTGLFPSSHGSDAGHLRLDDERLALAEALQSAGYRTVAYSENPWVGKDYNFDQGFDTFEEIWRKIPKEGGDKGAGLTNVRIDQWLTWRQGNPEAREQPFFLFVNYLETHLPYNPPEPERFRFLSPPIDMQRVERMSRFKHPDEMKFILGATSLDPADLRMLSDLYDGSIAYADRRTGEVIEMLRRRSLLDGTVLVVTADHGELLGEHRLLDHKMNVFEPVLRIPMVLRYPAAVKAGQRIREPVLLQDLYPTLLGLAGIPPAPGGGNGEPPAGGGRSAARESVPLPGVRGLGLPSHPRGGAAADGRRPEPIIAEFARPVSNFLDVMREAAPGRDISAWDRAVVAYRVGDEKLHWSSDGHHRLYDLAADPSEEHDLASERPERVRDLAAEVEAWLARPGARPPLGTPPPVRP